MKRLCILLALGACASPVLAGTNDPHSFKATTSDAAVTEEQKEDIGDIRPQGTGKFSQYLYGSAQVQTQYTTNAKLLGNHSSSDGIATPALQGGMAVPLGAGFSADLLGRIDSAFYATHGDRDFWGASIAGTIDWRGRPAWPRLYATAEKFYYQDLSDGNLLSSALALTTGVEQQVILNRGRTLLFGGYSYSHYFANPDTDDRNTNRFILGITQQLCPRLYAQLFYSFQYTDFEARGRHDLRNAVGLNFTYQFSQKLFGTVSTSFVDNDSNLSINAYQSVNVGAGVTWQF